MDRDQIIRDLCDGVDTETLALLAKHGAVQAMAKRFDALIGTALRTIQEEAADDAAFAVARNTVYGEK